MGGREGGREACRKEGDEGGREEEGGMLTWSIGMTRTSIRRKAGEGFSSDGVKRHTP